MSQPLFDDCIPVTEAEVQEWLDTIPNLSAATWRREIYRKNYRIDEKIRNLKRSGQWPRPTNP